MTAGVDKEVQRAGGNYHQLVSRLLAISHQRLGCEEESLCLEHQLREGKEGRREEEQREGGVSGCKEGTAGGEVGPRCTVRGIVISSNPQCAENDEDFNNIIYPTVC